MARPSPRSSNFGWARANGSTCRSRSGAPLPAARRSPRSANGRTPSASGSSGTRSRPRRRMATTRSRAGSTTRSPSRWLPRHSPTCCGWRRSPRTSRTPGDSPGRSMPCIPTRCWPTTCRPSFNWDTTGLTDDEMRRFPEELGALGFVFNFITYGGHQIDGLAAEEFATALRDDGMLALARLQRKFRLLESPYRTPQSLVGGDRLDAALMAASGRTAATKAMGKGSTQHQHLAQTEVPTRLLEAWLATWANHWGRPEQDPRGAAAPHGWFRPPGASRVRRRGRPARQRDLRQHRGSPGPPASSRSATRTPRRRSAGGG